LQPLQKLFRPWNNVLEAAIFSQLSKQCFRPPNVLFERKQTDRDQEREADVSDNAANAVLPSGIWQINRANFATYDSGNRVQLRGMALFLSKVLL
jgi:hypothetical protein